jgi:jasmonate ZIM domain-containing protein
MERDFLGLGSKISPITVKEELVTDSAPMKCSGFQWSFSKKASAIPQYVSFKPAEDDKPRKTVYETSPSSGFMPISTVDAFDSNQKPFTGIVQKNMMFDKQGRNHYVMTSHGLQQIEAYPVHRSQEVKMFPVSNQSNQTIKVSMSSPHIQPHLGSSGQNHVSKNMNQQFVAPISVLPPQSSVVGTTDSRNASKPSDAPTQLTIFYAGSVCVYEDITPEKAQAIMLLAGNQTLTSQTKIIPTAPMQAPISRPFAVDTRFASKSHAGISSPISTTSHVVSQYGGGGASSTTNELTTSNLKGALASSATPTVVNSTRTSATHLVSSVAVPQARKASLARFLEKRKERVMSTSPYNVSKISPDGSIPESECLSLSVNSAGSSHFHPINQERNLT